MSIRSSTDGFAVRAVRTARFQWDRASSTPVVFLLSSTRQGQTSAANDITLLDAVSPANACGIVMCLSNAVGFPSTITDLMPSVERARQRMYDMSKLLCPGTSMPMDLPFPELVPP